jgi:hypothetical protein
MQFCDTALPGTTRTLLSKALTGDRFRARFRLNAMEHVLDSHDFKYTFIAGLNLDSLLRVDSSKNPWETTWVEPSSETTCTVTMAETIPGKVRMHAWEKTTYLRDSVIIIPPADTQRLPFYTDVMNPCDTIIEKPIDGASIEGCVLKKVNGEWQLWKMAGGGRFYAPGPQDAPSIYWFYLKSSGRTDTVILRPGLNTDDPNEMLHYAIQRFYSAGIIDSADNQLLKYAVGDWVTVSNLRTNQGNAYDYLYFNGRRYESKDTVKFAAADTGIHRLSLEHIPATVLWEVDAAKSPYNATTWGIPIRIQ